MRRPLDQRPYQVAQQQGVADEEICTALPLLRARYFAMVSGQTTQQVRDGDRWQSFHPGSAVALKHEITRLELLCSARHQVRAVRAGPPRPLLGRQGYGNPFRYY